MGDIILWIGAIVLIAQTVLLVYNCKKGKLWILTLIVEAVSLNAALISWLVFNMLPGKGFMPGVTYFTEALYSVGLAFVYAVMLVVTGVIVFGKNRKY